MRVSTLIGALAALSLGCATQQAATHETSAATTSDSSSTTASGAGAGSTTAPGAGGTMAEGAPIGGEGGRSARAQLESRSGSQVTGVAEFVEMNNQVELTLRISGASPGEHGAHLHETGDCSAPDATSAGGHWNPANTQHGGPDHQAMSHAGDLGNITVGEDGTGTLRITRDNWSIGPSHGKHDILGRAVVVHATADDLKSQPAGNSGARQACGVISGS